ncbi:hypothetical protein F5877DRAFT_86459 [Lentinula edodes]|nr:hypothetical protein F5877DRAFT_86459 [Lentinula edodes]
MSNVRDYSALSFPFSEVAVPAFFGAGASPSTSFSAPPSISLSSSSSLSTTLRLFLDKPNGPASGISGGDFLLLTVSVINQSNFRLKCRWHLPVGFVPPSHFTVDGLPEYEHRTLVS